MRVRRLLGPSVLITWSLATADGTAAQSIFGRLQGHVLYRVAAPVAGATVSLDGTVFTAVTDSAGRYWLRNIPAGSWVLRVGITGREDIVHDVQVLPDATVRFDIQLGQSPLPTDPFTNRFDLSTLPFDDPRHALSLYPGVVLRGHDRGIDQRPRLTIRGSAQASAGAFVDGAPVRLITFGGQGIDLSPHAIDLMEVQSGVAPASVTSPNAGLIAYVTRAGGPRLNGALDVGTDRPFGEASTVGYTRVTGWLGGPLPGLATVHWRLGGTLYGQESAYRGIGAELVPVFDRGPVDTTVAIGTDPELDYVFHDFPQSSGECGGLGNSATDIGREIQDNYGAPCLGLRRPMDWTSSRRLNAKISASYGAGSSIMVSALSSVTQQRFYPGTALVNPALYSGARATSALMALNWSQRLSSRLTFQWHGSIGRDRFAGGPLEPESERATRDPALAMAFDPLEFTGLDSIPFPLTEEIIRNIRTNGGLRTPFLGRNDLRNAQFFRDNPYGMAAGWPSMGLNAFLTLLTEDRIAGRWSVNWEPRPSHTVTAGVETGRTRLTFYDANLINDVNLNAFMARPTITGGFVRHRIDAQAFQIDYGVRLDRFSPGAEFPRIPGRTFTNPDAQFPQDGDSAYAAYVDTVFERGQAQTVVSPRLRISYSVSAATVVRFAFGRHVLIPPFSEWLVGTNSDVSFTPSSNPFGRDVNLASTTILEAGVTQGVSRRLTFDAAIFRKSRRNGYRFRLENVDSTIGPAGFRNVFSGPVEDGVWGLESRLQWSPGASAYGLVGYGYTAADVLVEVAPGDEFLVPDLTTHALYALATVTSPRTWGALGGGLQATTVFRLTSGEQYTSLSNAGLGVITPEIGGGQADGPFLGARLPSVKTLDLRLGKQIGAGPVTVGAFLEVRNALGTTNLLAALAETGADTNAVFREFVLGPERDRLFLGQEPIDLGPQCSDTRSLGDCVALTRVENRFGDGDGILTPTEFDRALGAFYDAFFGPWRFRAPGRTARLGLTLQF